MDEFLNGKCIREVMKRNLQTQGDLQVSWSEKRYNDLHNAYKRFDPKSRKYFCEYIVGDCSSTTDIPYVRWDKTIEPTDVHTLYWFHTTKKTVRVYLCTEDAKIATGFVSHP